MKGGFILRHKRGSVFYGVLLMVLISSVFVRSHRLLRSHQYIEGGIYSVDALMHGFQEDLLSLEEALNKRFEDPTILTQQLDLRKTIVQGDFTITFANKYNEENRYLILVYDGRTRHRRRVSLMTTPEGIQLKSVEV